MGTVGKRGTVATVIQDLMMVTNDVSTRYGREGLDKDTVCHEREVYCTEEGIIGLGAIEVR